MFRIFSTYSSELFLPETLFISIAFFSLLYKFSWSCIVVNLLHFVIRGKATWGSFVTAFSPDHSDLLQEKMVCVSCRILISAAHFIYQLYLCPFANV